MLSRSVACKENSQIHTSAHYLQLETDIAFTNVFIPQVVVYSLPVAIKKKGPWNCLVQAYQAFLTTALKDAGPFEVCMVTVTFPTQEIITLYI